MTRRIVRVTRRQVESARLLVKLSEHDGVPVEPIIVRIAQARPEEPGDRPEEEQTAAAG